jgi:hypothetical protein
MILIYIYNSLQENLSICEFLSFLFLELFNFIINENFILFFKKVIKKIKS